VLNYPALRLVGVIGSEPFGVSKENVFKAVGPMLSMLGKSEAPTWGELHVDDGFIGDGYAVPTRESREAARLFAETEGILLDPVYTSKAAAGLLAYCREQKFKETDRVLFWHTGGVLTLL